MAAPIGGGHDGAGTAGQQPLRLSAKLLKQVADITALAPGNLVQGFERGVLGAAFKAGESGP